VERIRWLTHNEVQVLFADLSYCPPEMIRRLVKSAGQMIRSQPAGSVLVMADLTGAEFDREAVITMKEVAAIDRPHVVKAAWVGVDSLPRVWFESLQRFSQREFRIFETKEQALKFLTEP